MVWTLAPSFEMVEAMRVSVTAVAEMGMSIQLEEQSDKEHQIWQDEGVEENPPLPR